MTEACGLSYLAECAICVSDACCDESLARASDEECISCAGRAWLATDLPGV